MVYDCNYYCKLFNSSQLSILITFVVIFKW